MEDDTEEPEKAAEAYVCAHFPNARAVLKGVQHYMIAQLGTEPGVRTLINDLFIRASFVNVSPTEKGKAEIDEQHEYYVLPIPHLDWYLLFVAVQVSIAKANSKLYRPPILTFTQSITRRIARTQS